MNKTQKEWVKNPDGSQGYTWNPITGCLNHINGLCKGGSFPCYVYKLAHGRLKQRYLINKDLASCPSPTIVQVNDPFYPRFWEERLEDMRPSPYRRRFDPFGVFVCDMSDLFGIGIPEEWTKEILDIIKMDSWDRFYLLTKQPQNLIKFSPFPDNCFVGVTVTNKTMYPQALAGLNVIEARVKYISFEPLLSPIPVLFSYAFDKSDIDWLIIGAQTKPSRMPEIAWVREIIEAADKAGIPVFLKDNLKPLLMPLGEDVLPVTFPLKDTELFIRDGKLRQEIPEIK